VTRISEPEELLHFQLKVAKSPVYERQFRIHPERRFMADFYFPAARLVVEVDGGGWVNGRHSRGKGIESDAQKSWYIALMPARLMRVTPAQIKDGTALAAIMETIHA